MFDGFLSDLPDTGKNGRNPVIFAGWARGLMGLAPVAGNILGRSVGGQPSARVAADEGLTMTTSTLTTSTMGKSSTMEQPTEALACRVVSTPVGDLRIIASADGVRAVLWPQERPGRVKFGSFDAADGGLPQSAADEVVDPAADRVADAACAQLTEYFAGDRQDFDVAVDLSGTDFQGEVWNQLAGVPFGETTTYGQLAHAMGKPDAVRAVASAIGRNPVSILLGCHRVVGSDGSLTGFAGGLDAKRFLLELEADH